jgi:carbon-monoxide dehydrogenase large subunit
MSAPAHQTPAARYVGQTVPRKEDPRLLTGRGRYVDDIALPGMLHAAFVRSPYARATIKRIDTAAARALPGVFAVYTAADLNGMVKAMKPGFFPPAANFPPDYLPLAAGDVRFVGDMVALVVAEDRYIAEDAVELVEVDYEQLEPVLDYLAAEKGPPIHKGLKTNLIQDNASPPDPELDKAFAAAAHVIEARIDQQNYLPVPMETRGIVVTVAGPGELSIWMTTQAPQFAARYFAQVFGLSVNQIRIQAQDVGGGFGQKIHPMRDDISVTCAALRLGRPVKWIEDRVENLSAGTHARQERATAKMAFDADGRILAAHLDFIANDGAFPWLASGTLTANVFPGPYRLPKYGWRVRSCFTNTAGRGAYRGPWMMETVLRETLMDKAAKQLGIDAIELRRRNVLVETDLPYVTQTKQRYEAVSPAKTLEQAVGKANYAAFRAEQAAARKQGRYLGIGLSLYMEPTGTAGGATSTNVADIRMEPSGDVIAVCNTAAQGQGTETTMAMIIADELGIDLEKVKILQGDSSQTAFGFGAGGSRQAVIGGGAAKLAASALREKILKIAGHLMEASDKDLVIEKGQISVVGVPQMSIPITKVAETAYMQYTKLPPGMEPGLEVSRRYAPEATSWASATHICTVEVDADTGMVKLLRWIASEDCGVMINPAIVAGQVAGGVAQAIGGVLMEHAPYDAAGNPLAVTFKDYLLPLISTIPEIEMDHVHTPSKSLGGFKGAGEGGAIVGPSTVINAVTDALAPFGVDCSDLPLTPAKLVAKIEAARRKAA